MYNWAIWLVALVPFVSILLVLAWNPVLRYRTIDNGTQSIQMLEVNSVFTPTYFVVVFAGFIGYAICIGSAYLDWRKLTTEGVIRPFHWAWAILSPAVYVIGRSAVVHKVARPRGLAHRSGRS